MIKIINGVYGHYTGGRVERKDNTSAPFSLTEEQEARLVEMGVAVYVDEPVTPTGDKPIGEMNAKELRALGAEYDLHFKVGMTKAGMVAAIEAAMSGTTGKTDAEDEPPVFDPAGAVE